MLMNQFICHKNNIPSINPDTVIFSANIYILSVS